MQTRHDPERTVRGLFRGVREIFIRVLQEFLQTVLILPDLGALVFLRAEMLERQRFQLGDFRFQALPFRFDPFFLRWFRPGFTTCTEDRNTACFLYQSSRARTGS